MFSITLLAASVSVAPGSLESLDDAARRAIVLATAEHLREGYVLPEIAERTATHILEAERKGTYRPLRTPEALAKRLTLDLRAASRDRHLAVVVDRSKENPEENDPVEAWEAEGREKNGGITEARVLPGNVGYLRVEGLYDPSVAAPAIEAGFRFIANTRALIVDLRGNGGGHPDTGRIFEAHLYPPNTVVFRFEYRPTRKVEAQPTPATAPGPRYLDRPVAVIIGPNTFSGGEAIAYGLQTVRKARVYGRRSGGAANPWEARELPHGLMLQLPSGRPVSPVTGTNWEGVGVIPDVPVDRGDPVERARRDLAALTASAGKG